MPYRDMWTVCQKCDRQFVFTVEEQRRLEAAGLPLDAPKLCPDCSQVEEMTPGPHEGVIKWFSAEKGYGFLVQPSGSEIFFHRRSVVSGTVEQLNEGVRVRYMVEQSVKGPQAAEVVVLDD